MKTLRISLLILAVLAIAAPLSAKTVAKQVETKQYGDAQVSKNAASQIERVPEVFGGDFTVTSISIDPTVTQGDSVHLVGGAVTINFTGYFDEFSVPPLSGVSFRVYLSEDPVITTADFAVGTASLNTFDGPISGTHVLDLSRMQISYFSPVGDVYFGVIADYDDRVGEDDETNNTASTPVEVIGVPQSLVYYEDFNDGTAGGWFPTDLTSQGLHMYRVSFTDTNITSTSGVWWCGESNSFWPGGRGYGNSWDQRLTKSFSIPAGGASITYSIQYDLEPGYDYVDVEISTDGGGVFASMRNDGVTDWDGDTIPDDARHNGKSFAGLPTLAMFEEHSIDLSAYGGQTVLIRFRMTSDAAWSDEDNLWPTDGAYRLDWVQVTGSAMDVFETGGDGWVPSAREPVGGEYRLVGTPECDADVLDYCSSYGVGGLPAITCWSWVAYDPVTGQFPAPLGDGSEPQIAIESDEIPIPTDFDALFLRFDVYARLQLAEGVFYKWEVSAPPGSGWRDANFVYYNGGDEITWFTVSNDVAAYVDPGATSMKIRLIGTDLGGSTWGGTIVDPTLPNGHAPMFDNVRLIAINTTATGLDETLYPRPCGATTADIDGDGVPNDGTDLCPTESAAQYDRDGDGCVDPVASGRHVEYWDVLDMPLAYSINADGAPDVSDGSDFAAINNAMNAWTTDANTEVSVTYLGTTSQAVANSYDGQNTITFSDHTFAFPAGVLAVATTTSFDIPTNHMGTEYRPGQIFDSDMIFNPAEPFQTATQGEGSDIQAVATHEGGHMFGLSHSAIRTSTMFYVLPRFTEAQTLEWDDAITLYKAYPNETTIATGTRLQGTVTDGNTGLPLGGVIVYAINSTTGDTTACDYTLPARGVRPGTYDFVGLPPGSYYVAIHALDGTSDIGFIEAGNINHVIDEDPAPDIVAEYWDATESNSEDPMLQTAVTLVAGATVTADFETNVDTTPPTVTAVFPGPGAVDVAIDAAVLVRFSESIDGLTLSGGNFDLSDAGTSTFVPGAAALIQDDSTLLFSPTANLAFSTAYNLTIANVTDVFGNAMDTPFAISFTTEAQPPVSISSLTPNKAVAGAVMVVNGLGFDPLPANNRVQFDGVPLVPTSGDATHLVVDVPAGALPGVAQVDVLNLVSAGTSNQLNFTVLAPEQAARGFVVAEATLHGVPRAVAVSATGVHAFVATNAGATAVEVLEGPGYLTTTSIPVAGGLNGIAGTPDGKFMYAVSTANEEFYRINADPASGALAIVSTVAIGDAPRGIVISPSGRRAFIATDMSEIQIWDVNETSAAFETRVGTIASLDPNIGGAMAINPAGDKLMVATIGTGNLLVYDIASRTPLATIGVQTDPADVVVEPGGQRAYVTDRFGYVSVVSLSSLAKIVDIATAGSMRGAAITSAGSYLYAADNYLNFLTVIDLVSDSPTYRGVKTRISQPNNPVDVVFSPEGLYAYTAVEDGSRLVITAIGVGPVLESMSVNAGPEGARLTLAGQGLTDVSKTTSVSFGTLSVPAERESETALTVAVPAGAVSGPVSVVLSEAAEPDQISNSLYFEVLGPSGGGGLREAGSAAPSGGGILSGTVAVTPDDAIVAVGGDGTVHLLDNRSSSATFNTFIADAATGAGTIADIVVTPDSRRAFASAGTSVYAIDVNPNSPTFGAVLETLPFTGPVTELLTSSDGRYLLVSEPGVASVHLFNTAVSPATPVTTTPTSDAGLNGIVGEMAMHPGGTVAYLTIQDDAPTAVVTIDVDPASPTFGENTGTHNFVAGGPGHVPLSLSFSPDGARCYVLTDSPVVSADRSLVTLNASTPGTPVDAGNQLLTVVTAPAAEHVRVSPAGDRLLVNTRGEGFAHFDVGTPPAITPLDALGGAAYAAALDFAYGAGADQVYAASAALGQLYRYDFNAAQQMDLISGDAQTGVINEELAAQFRVRVTDIATTDASVGVPVTFEVTGGGGHFATDDPTATPTLIVVPTDAAGFARARLVLGPTAGPNSNTVEAQAVGVTNSPIPISASSTEDPETLPLALASLSPVNGATGVSVTTVISATFSRPVALPLPNQSFFLSADGGVTSVPVIVGSANGNRTVSLTPQASLAYSTSYGIVTTSLLLDTDLGALTNPTTNTFTTQPPPPVTLNSIAPPSAPEGADVVLSGEGFDPVASGNTVWFGSLSAVITSATTNSISAVVPVGAATGTVRVEAFSTSSDSIPFTVVDPAVEAADEVIATAGTGTSPRGVSVGPDGTYLYSVAPDANLLIPVNVVTFVSEPGIPVGDRPWALALNPEGTYAYVANLESGDVSVVDIDATSVDFHTVVDNINVGTAPNDVIVTPDGDNVIVSNAGSSSISIIDADAFSGGYHTVVATVGTGSPPRGVAVGPDGGRIFVGTDMGYTVIDALSYAVTATVGTGRSTRGVAVGPDGTLLIILTSLGEILVYNVVPDSHRENQVVATIGAGNARGVAVGPDGTTLYLLGGEGDVISEYSLDVGTSVAVLDPDAVQAPTELTLIRTIQAGENPQALAFLPDGSGDFVVANAGDATITLLSSDPVAPVVGSVAGVVLASCPGPGTPLSGVVVNVSDATPAVVATTVTNGSGAYQVDDLDVGDYTVAIETPVGYVTATSVAAVTILDGVVTPADFNLDCAPGGIGGLVLADCPDPDSGVPSVTVNISEAGGGPLVATIATDSSGAYDVQNLAVGDYEVDMVVPAGYTTASATSAVTVSSLATTTADFALECLGSVAGLVTGDCPDPDTPLEGIAVTLFDAASDTAGTTVTDASGFYQFVGLAVADYNVVIVSPPGYAGAVAAPATVVGLGIATVDFPLECLGGIAGIVSADCPEPDSGVFGVGVSITSVSSGLVVATASTDSSGMYETGDLPNGDYLVDIVLPDNYTAASTQSQVAVQGQAIAMADFALTCVGDIVGTVAADCPDPGTGLSGIAVTLSDTGGPVATATTDTSGAYWFTDLIPGAYSVSFTPPAGYLIDSSSSPATVVGLATTAVDFALNCESTLGGRIAADCPEPDTGLSNVEVDLFTVGASGQLVATVETDTSGTYSFGGLVAGNYMVTILSPHGYQVDSEDVPAVVVAGLETTVDFDLVCAPIEGDVQKMSFWKHQLAKALQGNPDEIDGAALCDYLDMVAEHFNSHRMNPVVVYVPPASGECDDKLQVAKDLLNLKGQLTEEAKARQQLLSLLFNVAGNRIHLSEVISADGATVSKAITFVDDLIHDGDASTDMLARKTARDINQGKQIAAGVIPLDIRDIRYTPGKPKEFALSQNYPNPFNPETTIAYELASPVHVSLKIYDVQGRLVRTLVNQTQPSERYAVRWDGRNNQGSQAATGVYFYRLEAGSFVKTKKMVMLK